MLSIIVVNNPKDWEYPAEDAEVVSAKAYLTDPKYSEMRNARVFNLCRSRGSTPYPYQSEGYYVSLLAEARGHKVIPNVITIQDLKSQTIIRYISDDLDKLIQKSFSKLKATEFVLSVYFGRNLVKQYDNLSRQLYNLFQAPLFRTHFVFNKKWTLKNIFPISISEVNEYHKPYMSELAKAYFSKKRFRNLKKIRSMYNLAILVNPQEKEPPSDKKAIQNFITAAETLGLKTKLITKDDLNKISQFDALFIRETTAVNHHTYRFSRRAFAEGLAVIDDPESIVKCSNKVYLAELLTKAKIAGPRTMIVHKDNKNQVLEYLGLPCVLKKPDGSFSQGVVKVTTSEELKTEIESFLNHSDLIVAQEFIPTEYDWRIGILDKTPLFACKYYMAKNHWQIYNWQAKKQSNYGRDEALPIEEAPLKIVKAALKVANLIGSGFYGVDLKQVGDRILVIEVNDNPSVDSGIEDAFLKDRLYFAVIESILNRIEKIKELQR